MNVAATSVFKRYPAGQIYISHLYAKTSTGEWRLREGNCSMNPVPKFPAYRGQSLPPGGML
jgi:hypothetical protein